MTELKSEAALISVLVSSILSVLILLLSSSERRKQPERGIQ
jgi:hypothetical protein